MSTKLLRRLTLLLSASFISVMIGAISSSFVLGDERKDAGTGSLTLDQALQEGKDHSPEIQRAQAAYGRSHWQSLEALGSGFLPRLSASGNYYFNRKFEVLNLNFEGGPVAFPSIYPTTSTELDLVVPIFDGLANINRYKAASLQESAVENEMARTTFETEQSIRLAFYQALAASLSESVAEENVKTFDDHLKQTAAEKKGGIATNYDVLRVQVQLNEAQSDLIDAQDNVVLTRQKLNQLLGIDQDARALTGDLPVPSADPIKRISFDSKIAEDRTDVKALELRAEASDKERTANNVWWIPQASFGANYTWYNDLSNSITQASDFQSAYNLGIFVRWNLFDGGVSYARAKEAAYANTENEKNVEKARLTLPYDFDYWKRRYLSNASRFLAKQLDLERSQESVRLAREEQRAGTRTSSEVLDAELDLFRARVGVVNAQSNAAEAQIRLELALGRKI